MFDSLSWWPVIGMSVLVLGTGAIAIHLVRAVHRLQNAVRQLECVRDAFEQRQLHVDERATSVERHTLAELKEARQAARAAVEDARVARAEASQALDTQAEVREAARQALAHASQAAAAAHAAAASADNASASASFASQHAEDTAVSARGLRAAADRQERAVRAAVGLL